MKYQSIKLKDTQCMKRYLIIKIIDYDSNSNVSIKVDTISHVKEATSSVSGKEFFPSNH